MNPPVNAFSTFAVLTALIIPTTSIGQESAEESSSAITAEFVPGKGLDMKSPDGDFRLEIKVFGQMQYTANNADDEWTQAFALRRARLYLSGNFWGEHNKYYVQLAFSPQDLKFKDGNPTKSPVFDWYFKFDHLRDLTFQVGQYRVPFNKSRLIGYSKLQFVDRSAPNFEFNLDRDIGFDFRSEDLFGLDVLRYHAGIFIGEGRDGYGASDFGMLYVARLELLPLGIFNDYVEADLKRRKKPALAIGAAYAFLDDAKYSNGITGSVPADGGTSDIHTVTADLAIKFRGVSFSSEFYFRNSERAIGDIQALDDNGDPVFESGGVTPLIDDEDPRNGWGWFTQLGVMLPTIPVELAGRYSQVHPIGTDSDITRLDEIGVGLNWYIFGPSMALKTDYHHRYTNGTQASAYEEIRLSFQAGF